MVHLQTLARWQKPWQLASRYSVRAKKAIEAFVMKVCGDLLGLQELLWAMMRLNRGGRRSRLPPREDLPPPIGVGGGDPFAWADVLVGRDMAIHCPSRLAAHQLARSVAGYAFAAFV
jgi:hypothetical protein